MKGQGRPEGPTEPVDWKMEAKLVEQLTKMTEKSEHTIEEMVHMALKRYISQHKDWLE